MKTLLSLSAVVMLITVSLGCQPRGEYDALHRELFLKESKIYELQGDIKQYRSVLDSCRRANLAMEADLEGNADDQGFPGSDTNRNGTGSSDSGSREPTPFLPSVPEVDLPPEAEALPEIVLPPGLEGESSGPPPLFQGSRYSRPSPAVERQVAASTSVTTIELNKLLTGGFNMDGYPGDEGLLVVIEPRDVDSKIVEAIGDLSIVLLDSDAPEDQKRFARWDYQASEVSEHWRKSPLGEGLHFELPWPADPPTRTQMHVFARVTTADGRKLVADRPIKIELLDSAIATGLRRSIDRGVQRLEQPSSVQPIPIQPLEAEPTPLRSVLAGSLPKKPQPEVADTRQASILQSVEQPLVPEPIDAQPETVEADEIATDSDLRLTVEPEKRTPLREAKRRPEWRPFR